jgi:DNA gyrase subunit A
VDETDQILLVSDQGQLIRTRVGQVRLAGRNTQGVTIFRTSADEHVASVERLADAGEDDEVDVAEDEAGPESEAPEADTPPEA